MSDLINFPTRPANSRPEPFNAVWVCSCGCSTYFFGTRETGHYIECANCGADMSDDGYHEAVERLPPPIVEKPAKGNENAFVVTALGSVEAVRRNTLKSIGQHAEDGTLDAAFGFFANGASAHWVNVTDKASLDAILSRLRGTIEYLEQNFVTKED